MAKKLDPQLLEILTTYGERPEDALWDCHGTWVAYHKAIERIAAKAGVKYSNPTVLVAEREAAAILVTGELGDRTEWSIGEAVINLNYRVSGKQAAYPFAMAEKRAKDRVVLKLIGLHGLVYSEEESDDFKPNASTTPNTVTGPALVASNPAKPASSAELKRNGEWDQFLNDLYQCTTVSQVVGLYKAIAAPGRKLVWSKAWLEQAAEYCGKHKADILEREAREADADTFPGDMPANGNFQHPLMAGE